MYNPKANVWLKGVQRTSKNGNEYVTFIGAVKIGGKMYNIVVNDLGNGVVLNPKSDNARTKRGKEIVGFIKVEVSASRPMAQRNKGL